MRLNQNLASLSIYREQNRVLQKQSDSIGRISSGYKVNKTGHDPASLAKSERLRMQIRGAQMANRNMQDGIGMMQTTGGALASVNEGLIRIRDLSVKAVNSTNEAEERETIQNEISQIIENIKDIAEWSNFNGVKLLSYNSPDKLDMPVGANVGELVNIPTFNMTDLTDPNSVLSKLKQIDVSTSNSASAAISIVDDVLINTLDIAGVYGAIENRFDSGYANISELAEKMQSAESSLRDVDVAEEMMELAKSNILIEAGNALMAQSNKFPQEVLRILENMRK